MTRIIVRRGPIASEGNNVAKVYKRTPAVERPTGGDIEELVAVDLGGQPCPAQRREPCHLPSRFWTLPVVGMSPSMCPPRDMPTTGTRLRDVRGHIIATINVAGRFSVYRKAATLGLASGSKSALNHVFGQRDPRARVRRALSTTVTGCE